MPTADWPIAVRSVDASRPLAPIEGLARYSRVRVFVSQGATLVGSADIYAGARMNGQPYTSTVINGRDSFSFPGSYAPFTWIRSVPTFHRASMPVTSMTVRVETGNRGSAGTDDDVYLNIGRHRFSLDKRLYDDFERGDDDTYSVPIGSATRDGLTIGDISRVSIEKSKDGLGGGWFLGGGTDTALALRQEFKGHDRVVIVTDEQAGHDYEEVTRAVPAEVPMYTWNLAGYQAGHAPSGGRNRHTFGGLTDQAFRMIPLLERGRDARWAWEEASAA